MTERRYNEDEVAEIFARATEAQQGDHRQLASGSGMTLAELQEIGREVGIPSEAVARAVRSLEEGRPLATRRFLGFPLSVGRVVELGRTLSEEEWERLVVDLRDTFDARGRLRSEGSFRQWTNGNLQALLEPTPTGHRLRMRTTNGNARSWMTVGLVMVGTSLAAVLVNLVGGGVDAGTLRAVTMASLMGLGAFSVGALRLPAWARLRRRQMDDITSRLLLAPPPEDDQP